MKYRCHQSTIETRVQTALLDLLGVSLYYGHKAPRGSARVREALAGDTYGLAALAYLEVPSKATTPAVSTSFSTTRGVLRTATQSIPRPSPCYVAY